jgi:hypothetical protein
MCFRDGLRGINLVLSIDRGFMMLLVDYFVSGVEG